MKLTVLGVLATLLTAAGLHPTIEGQSWFWAAALCAVAAVAGSTVARLLGMPRPIVPLVGFLTLVLGVTQLSSRDVAVLGVFPGPGAVREYVDRMHDAFHVINVSIPPAPGTTSLIVLVAGGVGLVALLVDTFAVTYRASALAGLPLLALYGVPVSVVKDGVPWVYFALAALGWMTLVLAEGHERVGSWGRTIRRAADEPRTGRIMGRRIGAAALGLAVLVPAFLPGIGDGVLNPSGSTGGASNGRVLTVNPFVSLAASLSQPQNAVAFDYQTTTDSPGYITLVTLDRFDGTTWIPTTLTSNGPVSGATLPPLNLPPGVPQEEVSTVLHADGLARSTWLPTPTTLLSVNVDGPWVVDAAHRIPWSASGAIKDLTWTVKSVAVEPTSAQLSRAAVTPPLATGTRFLDLPTTIDPQVKEVADAVTAKAKTPFDKAVALQEYFRENFTYDATYRSPKQNPIGAFLAIKRGFCQQFAGTFAVMARQLGLPTRVVVGFLPGHTATNNSNGTWTVYWKDTHAWPEVYFDGVGWVRFEPTPRADNAGVSLPDYTLDATPGPAPTSIPVVTNRPIPRPLPSAGTTTTSSGSSWWSPGHLLGHLPWAWFGGVLFVLLLLVAPGSARRVLRRRRLERAGEGDPVDAALAAWQELEATCLDLGVEWPVSRTPRQTAEALIPQVSDNAGLLDAGPALARLGIATERAQFARTPAPTHDLDVDVSAVRVALLERRTTTERLRAEVLPRSVLRRTGAAVADLLDRVDNLLSARPWRRKSNS